MNERLYFEPEINSDSKTILLNEDESHHLLKVIRAQKGESLNLMNGKGLMAEARILDISKKRAQLEIYNAVFYPDVTNRIHLGICPIKKRDKLEMIVEKATEMGVSEISFIQSEFSERSKINWSRFEKIISSAAKQSVNPYAPKLNPLTNFSSFIENFTDATGQKFIAWCGTVNENHISKYFKANQDIVILIGPEGDFSEQEVKLASGRNFVPVNLGNLRLRSETAALFAISAIQALKEI